MSMNKQTGGLLPKLHSFIKKKKKNSWGKNTHTQVFVKDNQISHQISSCFKNSVLLTNLFYYIWADLG